MFGGKLVRMQGSFGEGKERRDGNRVKKLYRSVS